MHNASDLLLSLAAIAAIAVLCFLSWMRGVNYGVKDTEKRWSDAVRRKTDRQYP